MTLLGDIKARVADLPVDVEAQLATALAGVRTRWPDGPEPDAAFVELVAARLSAQPRLWGRSDNRFDSTIEDLYLAWWCRDGNTAGIAAFEVAFDDDLKVATARFRDLPADELRQQLRIKLFVGTAESAPKIRDFSGTGSLKSWLRVTAVRCFIDITRSTHHHREEQELDESELLGISDPQGTSIRAEVGVVVKKAFAAAVAKLTPRQRVFLRHAYVDHHTLDQIASHYSVHRTTVARTLASARQELIAATRAGVVEAIGIDDEELASVIRVLDSRIDLSLSRVFDARP